MPITLTTAIAGAATSAQARQGNVTFTLNDSYAVGNYVDGPAYVVVPSGTATITAISPAQSTEGTDVINGAEKNPVANSKQGYDQRATSSWEAAKTASLPISVTAGDVVVKGVSRTFAAVRDGVCSEFASLFVVSSAPAAGTFAPPACGWTGRTGLTGYTFDLDAIVAALPQYSTSTFSASVEPYAEVLGHISKHAPAYAQQTTNTNPTGGYESMLPYGMNGLGGNANYGQVVAETFNYAYLLMISDAITTNQKKELLKWFLHHGIQWWFPHQGEFDGSGYLIGGNGGHHQFAFMPTLMAIKHTGGLYADHAAKFPGNQLAQTFEITSPILTNTMIKHTGNSVTEDKPYPYRVRPITAVPSPTEISWDKSAANGDAAQSTYEGMNVYNAANDSLIATVTAQTYSDPTFTATVGTHGLTTADSIYFMPPFTLTAGTADWMVRQGEAATGFNTYNPAAGANYRGLQTYTASAIAARIETSANAAYQVLINYTERANAADTPAGYDLPDCHGFGSFASSFWGAHWSTINP